MDNLRLTDMSFRLDGIAHVLRDRLLRVPPYQRSYAWGDEQVAAFWSDLRAAMTDARTDYFLGTIVLAKDDQSRITVIDGQQRLATTSLLIAAIRDTFLDADDHHRGRVIESDYLATRDLRSAEVQSRIQLNRDDAAFYVHSVLGSGELPDRRLASHSRLENAYAFLKQQVKADADAAGAHWAERLFDWVDFLEKRVRAIVIEVPGEADAFLIFETLNDRGLALTIADLLKNYFLGLARDNLTEIEASWLSMVAAFDPDTADEVTTSYIRHYWSSLNGPTRERELYRSIRGRVRGPHQSEELVRDLNISSPLYAALLDPGHEKWSELEIPRDLVETVHRFGLEQPRPLLLACMQEFEPSQLRQLLDHLASWLVRGVVAGGIGGGTTERYYANAARAVRRRQARDVGAVFRELKPIIAADEEFVSTFRFRRITQPRLAKYLLLCLERALDDDAAKAHESHWVSQADESSVSVQHVLPRVAGAGWSDFPSSAGWYSRLGNQVLLPAGSSLAGPGSWPERRAALGAFDRPLAQAVASYPHWTPDRLNEHQELLAALATGVWPLFAEAD